MPLKPKDNLTYKQRQALNKLIIDDTIIINTLDQHTIHHNTARSQLHLNRHHNLNKMKKPTKSKDKGEPQQNTTHAQSHLHEPYPQKQPYFSDQRDTNNTYSTKPILQITNPPTNLRRSSLHTHKSPHKTCKHKANETPITSTPTPTTTANKRTNDFSGRSRLIRGTSYSFGVPGHQGGYNLGPHCTQHSWRELLHPSEWQSRGRPFTLAQTQQNRSKVCRDGGSHCLPSTRSECRRENGGSRICSNATFNTFPPKQHSNPSYPLLLSSHSHHFLLSSRASTLHRVP